MTSSFTLGQNYFMMTFQETNPEEEMMDEETLRKIAIEQYLQAKEPVTIDNELSRTKPWFFKWLKLMSNRKRHNPD